VTRWPQQPPVPRKPSSARSLAAWLGLVLLLGVGHVVPALHFLFVAHHLCAEHGELVDATAESAEPAREKPGNLSASCRAGAAAHRHEHCGVLALARASAAPATASGGVELAPAASVASPRGEARDAHVDIALLDYAPKLAPPCAAVRA
jgi:hypothetical protein